MIKMKYEVIFMMNPQIYEVKAKSEIEAEEKARKILQEDVNNNINELVSEISVVKIRGR